MNSWRTPSCSCLQQKCLTTVLLHSEDKGHDMSHTSHTSMAHMSQGLSVSTPCLKMPTTKPEDTAMSCLPISISTKCLNCPKSHLPAMPVSKPKLNATQCIKQMSQRQACLKMSMSKSHVHPVPSPSPNKHEFSPNTSPNPNAKCPKFQMEQAE